jgi:predicted XRE-type DNA-binding protein
MTEELELIRGSGNVFRDLGHPNADVEQLKAILAAEIIKILNRENLTTRQAEVRTKIHYSEFSRIRNVKLSRFTVDHLTVILNRLNQRVDFEVRVRPLSEQDGYVLGG